MRRFRSAPVRFKHWLGGSIRRKLTFFVVLVCFMLILLVWVLGVQLLEPAYNATIRTDLTKQTAIISSVLEKAKKDNLPMAMIYKDETGTYYTLSNEVRNLLDNELFYGELRVDNLCIDISDAQGQTMLVVENLASCALHNTSGLFRDGDAVAGSQLMELREEVLGTGSTYRENRKQIITGTLTADGTISLIVSTNLERIPQAVGVLRKLMMFVSGILIVISTLCAFVFSKWFAEPLTKLSAAAKQMAKGNYDVQVPASGSDEIAALSRDFNSMAKEVKRSAELQRDLLANVSHDLRTPLTLIKGYAETVRDLSGDNPEKRNEQLGVIVDETDRLSALVGSVMELSRVSSGNDKPNPVRFDLAQLCDELTYRYDALSRQQGYSFEYEGQEPCDIVSDPAMVERALHNMLGNALKHVGEDGYIGLKVFATDHDTARVEVIDHGPGVHPEDLPHLFDQYYRSRDDAGKPGTGLGLSITKAMFEALHFDYGVESTPGEGATFWFEAPLAKPEK